VVITIIIHPYLSTILAERIAGVMPATIVEESEVIKGIAPAKKSPNRTFPSILCDPAKSR